MAKIEIEYPVSICNYGGNTCPYDKQKCENFIPQENFDGSLNCKNECEEMKTAYKGFNTDSYEMIPGDAYSGDCMIVSVRGKNYKCDKVTLNGKVIFDYFSEK